MGAQPQPRSGAGPRHKEDAKNDLYLFQIKSALKAKSIVVRKEDLEELRMNAIHEGLTPAFVLDFKDMDDWIMIPRLEFEDLTR